MTGSKTRSRLVNVGPQVERGDCEASPNAQLATLFEIGADAGKASGVVSTARITHATPASAYAHSPDRDWENDGAMPKDTKCTDIASQLIAWNYKSGLDVILGGGRTNFLPDTMTDPEYAAKTGSRKDGRNLVTEWQAKHPDGQFIYDLSGFSSVDATNDSPVLGLFEPSHMQYEADRIAQQPNEPSLAEMVELAIAKLSDDENGYILMVEGGRIDHAHHGGNARRALEDTVALDTAIAKALKMVDLDETLVLVTADHSHVFTIAGYPPRNNPILGLGEMDEDGQPSPAKDGKPYTTLGYANGPGAVTGERQDLTHVDTQALDYQQQALVPKDSETHAGEDVALKAAGPQSHLFRGTLEQNTVFHIAKYILGL
jgi:alkaline phosphatase